MRGCDIFTAADAWLINLRNQDSNIPHHLAGSCTWAHTAHFRIHNLSRRNFHFPLECSIVVFSYFHDPQKIHWQKHWELEECPAPAPWVWHHGHKKAVSPIQWCTGPQSHRVTSLPSRRILSPAERMINWSCFIKHTSFEESSRDKKFYITFDIDFWRYLPSRSRIGGSLKWSMANFCFRAKIAGEIG